MTGVALVGYAHSDVVKHFGRPLGAVALETARAAIADAGLTPEQVDGFTSSAMLPSAGDHGNVDGVTSVSSNWMAEHLGVNPRYAAGFQGFGQLPGSMMLAVNALASGAATHVLVHRALHNPVARYHGNPMQEATGSNQWTAPQGWFGPLGMIGMLYNEYLQRYGASRESMAVVVAEARKNGARIPWSYWHGKPLTPEQYLAAPMVAEPICRFDADIPVDGVACFVLTTSDRAADLPHKAVHVAGAGFGAPVRRRLPLHWPLDDVYEVGHETARRLWTTSGLAPGDVDLPQLYDGFSPFIYLWLEVLGLCPVGEAHRFVLDGGIDSDSPTGLPILSGGGALGNGRMHGVPQLLECYLQLSGRAGERQRPGVEVGLACHSSPHFGGALLFTTEEPAGSLSNK